MSADPAFVKELQEQVRILGNRILTLDQENDQKKELLSKSRVDNALFNRLRDEHKAYGAQIQKLKQELAAENKSRGEAERLVAALERDLATKESLLERYHAEADLSERLSAVEPLLAALHEAVLSLSDSDHPEGGTP